MSTETEPLIARRRRRVVSFFGGFMLAVQAFLLYRFGQQVLADEALTPWCDRATLFERMAWLKAAPWRPPWFEGYVRMFVAIAAWTALVLVGRGFVSWWRNRDREGTGA
jgi:hypothetical protein